MDSTRYGFCKQGLNPSEILDKNKALDIIPLLIQQIVFEGHPKEVLNELETWHKEKLITDKQQNSFIERIQESSQLLDSLKHLENSKKR